MIDRNQVITILQQHGIRPTQQRIRIGELLFGSPKHVTADDVLLAISRGQSHVSKATVYNTLRLFAEKGLLREVVVDPTRMFFDTNLVAHHHFYNMDTGELIDMNDHCLTIGSLPEVSEDMEVVGVEVVVRVRRRSPSTEMNELAQTAGAKAGVGEELYQLEAVV